MLDDKNNISIGAILGSQVTKWNLALSAQYSRRGRQVCTGCAIQEKVILFINDKYCGSSSGTSDLLVFHNGACPCALIFIHGEGVSAPVPFSAWITSSPL